MPWWQWLVDVAGLCLLLVLVYAVGLLHRRYWLTRHGGIFELSYRPRVEKSGRGWVLGLGRYAGDDLEFFRFFSLRAKPLRVFPRSRFDVTGRREPTGLETASLYATHVVASCTSGDEPFELAMSPDALTGLLFWLESAPPGRGPRAH